MTAPAAAASGAGVPKIDRHIGIKSYYTGAAGCGGRIKSEPGDFAVREILSEASQKSIRQEGDYAVYSLTKRGADTAHCLGDIYRRHRVRLKALGRKDSAAHTTQYVCAVSKHCRLASFATPRYDVSLLGYARRPLTARAMVANRFDIVIRDCTRTIQDAALKGIVPNHYGYQRFGSRRPFNHMVGRAIMRRDFEEAVRLILYAESEYDAPRHADMRRRLREAATHQERLEIMPVSMDTERALVLSLDEGGGDCRRAILLLPLHLRRLYVQAYQSYLFNLTLSAAVSLGHGLAEPRDGDVCFDASDRLGRYDSLPGQRLALPMLGYAYYKKTRFDGIIRDVMREEGIAPADFYDKSMQEMSLEGGFRQAAITCADYVVSGRRVSFTLSRGSYATTVLREVIKPADPVLAGF